MFNASNSSHSKISRAKRLAPLTVSLAALMLVAACARTKGSALQVTSETPEQKIQAALQETGNFDHLAEMFSEKNMALSAKVLGATLTGLNRTTQGDIDLQLNVVIGDHEPIVAQGTTNKFGAALKITSPVNGGSKYQISASCGDDKCVRVAVSIVEQSEQDATPLPVGLNAAEEVQAEGTTAAPEAIKPVETTFVASKGPKQTVPTARIVMLFRTTTLKEGLKETDIEQKAREATFAMVWQTPSSNEGTDAMMARGKFSAQQGLDLKSGKATPEQIKAEVAAAKAKTDKAPSGNTDATGDSLDQLIDDGDASAPPAPVAAPVVAPKAAAPAPKPAPVVAPVAAPKAAAPASKAASAPVAAPKVGIIAKARK